MRVLVGEIRDGTTADKEGTVACGLHYYMRIPHMITVKNSHPSDG